MGVDLCELVKHSFVDVADELKDSLVFVDKACYDVIEWTVGVAFLLGLGIRGIDIISHPQRNVLSSPFFLDEEETDVGDLKLSFITSQFIWETFDLMEVILQSKKFTCCTIYASLSELAHIAHPTKPASLSRQSPYDFFTNKITSVITSNLGKGPSRSSKIVHFPLSGSIFITKSSLLLPTVSDFSPIFPYIPPSPKPGDRSEVAGINLKEYPDDHAAVHKLVHSLADLLLQLGAGELCRYGVGPTSQLVCREVNSVHQLARESPHPPPAVRTVSLVLIDRTLDLASPVSHSDFTLDRVCTILRSSIPQPANTTSANSHSNTNSNSDSNSGSNSTPTSTSNSTSSSSNYNSTAKSYLPTYPRASIFPLLGLRLLFDVTDIAPLFPTLGMKSMWATLTHPLQVPPKDAQVLEVISSKAWKDALTAVRRRIVEECNNEGVDLSTVKAVSGNVTPQALLSLAAHLHRKSPYKHAHLLQLVGILAQTAHAAPFLRWDPLMGIEKMVLMSLRPEGSPEEEEGEESLATYIVQILNRSVAGSADKTARFTVREALSLIIFAYSLMGEKEFSWKDEKLLQDTILNLILDHPQSVPIGWLGDFEAIIEERHLAKAKQEQLDEDQEQQRKRELRDKVEETFERLKHVAHARERVQDYRNIAVIPKGSPAATYSPLVTQVLKDVLQRGEAIARMRHVSQSLAGAMGSLLKKFASSSSRSSSSLRHPRDSDCVVLLVLGGVSPLELREAQDVIGKSKDGGNVFVGGTGIVTPNDVYERIFCKGRSIT